MSFQKSLDGEGSDDTIEGMKPKGRIFILLCALAVGLATTCLILDGVGWSQKELPAAVSFQQTVKGLGLGGCVVPKGCFRTFDPRLERYCTASMFPMPGEGDWCLEHSASALTFPSNENGQKK